MRRLKSAWDAGTSWPRRLNWIEVDAIRGWSGQRFELRFPIMAVVGENGSGKSTLLQAAASVYAPDPGSAMPVHYASTFFPDTPWDRITGAQIRASVREGESEIVSTIRKKTSRWRGNNARRIRHVEYIDLSRIQPVSSRTGYTRLANPSNKEHDAQTFGDAQLQRFRSILGRHYDGVRIATTDIDVKRGVPVITNATGAYSGFHQGAGEITLVELLQRDIPKHSLLLIDEVESSLHPRMQRRLIRDLATACRDREIQVVLTTHSPFVLEELPAEARAYIHLTEGARDLIYGVSPEFAMSQIDDEPHFECELFVEDARAEGLLREILVAHSPDLVRSCRIIKFGTAGVGKSLGLLVDQGRLPRPTCIFLDGDVGATDGCHTLPGGDAPEPVVFQALAARNWEGLAERTGRQFADVADACSSAMTLSDPHEWVASAASSLLLGGDILWQAMCAEWATTMLSPDDARAVTDPVRDALNRPPSAVPAVSATPAGTTSGGAEPVSPPVSDAPGAHNDVDAAASEDMSGDRLFPI